MENTTLLLIRSVQLFNYTACPSQQPLQGLFCAKHTGRLRTFSCLLPHCPDTYTSCLVQFSPTPPWFSHSICSGILPKTPWLLTFPKGSSQHGLTTQDSRSTPCDLVGFYHLSLLIKTLTESVYMCVWVGGKRPLMGGDGGGRVERKKPK